MKNSNWEWNEKIKRKERKGANRKKCRNCESREWLTNINDK